MKVFLASLLPLLASLLLLPSEVECRRRVREDGEYEVSHIRKRSMKFKDYFLTENLQKTCSLCQKHYGIDEDSCINGKRKAKYKCMLKVKENRAYFQSMWTEPSSPAAGRKPETEDDYFLPQNLKKTCKICEKVAQLNVDDCIADLNGVKLNCRYTVIEFSNRFAREWDKLPMHEHKMRHLSKRSIAFGDFFRGNNLQRVCSLCQKHYGIDEANCIVSRRRAKYKCMVKVKDNRAFFESKWTESNSPAAGTVPKGDEYFNPENLDKTCKICGDLFKIDSANCAADQNGARQNCKNMVYEMPNTIAKQWKRLPRNEFKVRHIKKRSKSLQDVEGGNLQMICSVCHKYFGVDEAICVKNTPKVTQECQDKVKESPTFLESKKTKSNSPAVGQPSDVVDFSGAQENIQQMCSICDQLFHFSSSDCVADKNSTRQKCSNWINEYEKLIKLTQDAHGKAPGSAEGASLALSNVQRHKIKI